MNWKEKLKSLNLRPGEIGQYKQFRPLKPEDIAAIESTFSAKLPPALREFLVTYGEASFGELVVFKNKKKGISILVEFFLSAEGLHWFEELPKNVLPFTSDSAGNCVCVSLRNELYGEILYWKHDAGISEKGKSADERKFNALAHLADDFEGFVQGLEVYSG